MSQYINKILTFIKTPHGAFVYLALFFGAIFLIAIPPLQTPDESAHFLRAYEISQGGFITKNVNSIAGDYLPDSVGETLGLLERENPIKFLPDAKYKLSSTKEALGISLNKSDKSYFDISAASGYAPVGYVPQSIGILTGHVFNAPPVVSLYLARVAILCAWIGLGFLAIKIIPYRKWTICGILLFPMYIAQSVSIGVDAVSIGVGLVFFCSILKILQDKRVTRGMAALVVVSAIMMVLSKQIMVVLLPLVLMINKDMFTSRFKSLLLKITVIIVPLLALSTWSLLGTGLIEPGSGAVPGSASPAGQIAFLLGHPLHFVKVLLTTFFFGWGDGVVKSVIGVFGWMDTALPLVVVIFGYIMLALMLVYGYKERGVMVKRSLKLVSLVVAVTYSLAVCAALYVAYTPVGFNIVVGVQGRYLLPAVLLLTVVFYGFSYISRRKYVSLVLFSVVPLALLSVVTIIFRYYINYTY